MEPVGLMQAEHPVVVVPGEVAVGEDLLHLKMQLTLSELDLPVKLSQTFTLTPSYRFYSQNQVDYFAPYETHLSTERYYTSDYDLSKFVTRQYSLALIYNQIFPDFILCLIL